MGTFQKYLLNELVSDSLASYTLLIQFSDKLFRYKCIISNHSKCYKIYEYFINTLQMLDKAQKIQMSIEL